MVRCADAVLDFLNCAVDAEAATAAVRQVVASAGSPIGNESLLQQVFLAIGWDKSEAPEPAEGDAGGEGDGDGEGDADADDKDGDDDEDAGAEDKDKAADDDAEDGEGDGSDAGAAPAPAAEPVVSNNAMDVWTILVGEDAEASADVRDVMAQLAVRCKGYGEAQLRFAVSLMDSDGASGVDEGGLWKALAATAAAPIEGIKRNHMRRLWRAAETWMPAMPEEGDEVEPEAMEAAKAAVEAAKDAPRRVVVESWFEKLGEDEFASGLLMPEIDVPKTDKVEGEGDEDEEDE
jgi:uncharacterized spore protein YtfJ